MGLLFLGALLLLAVNIRLFLHVLALRKHVKTNPLLLPTYKNDSPFILCYTFVQGAKGSRMFKREKSIEIQQHRGVQCAHGKVAVQGLV